MAEARKATFRTFEEQEVPHHFQTRGPVYHGNRYPHESSVEIATDADVLKVTGCYPRIVASDIRLIFSPKDALSVNGKLLVTVGAEPGWTPRFPATSGIVVERGSRLSHSAVVARELGMPAIVRVPELTEDCG